MEIRRARARTVTNPRQTDCYVALLRHTDTIDRSLGDDQERMNEDVVLDPVFLSDIQTPAYFLWGEDDPFGPPEVARSSLQ